MWSTSTDTQDAQKPRFDSFEEIDQWFDTERKAVELAANMKILDINVRTQKAIHGLEAERIELRRGVLEHRDGHADQSVHDAESPSIYS
ncbi:MAG: hypothetical protein J4432_03680 [DPANN group archaeon]|nr:hypothetical protein [DPANN group archaeon]